MLLHDPSIKKEFGAWSMAEKKCVWSKNKTVHPESAKNVEFRQTKFVFLNSLRQNWIIQFFLWRCQQRDLMVAHKFVVFVVRSGLGRCSWQYWSKSFPIIQVDGFVEKFPHYASRDLEKLRSNWNSWNVYLTRIAVWSCCDHSAHFAMMCLLIR